MGKVKKSEVRSQKSEETDWIVVKYFDDHLDGIIQSGLTENEAREKATELNSFNHKPFTSYQARRKESDNKWSTDMGRGVVGTFHKSLINILDPDPETIFLEDIVQGLIHTCRWNGQIKHFYSVAQHSLHVAGLVSIQNPEFALQALFHDASEAFMNDLSSPVKELLPEYKNLEERLMIAIAIRFGFDWPIHPEVKELDMTVLQIEHQNLRMGENYACHYEAPEMVYSKFMIRAKQWLDFRVWNKVRKEANHG
ncbi:hypothetical protein [Roseivirga sp. UBA1976]|uniref:hypothetical protein n=1 Tax=Roseivirga sp. UBA1976 TaxID=1947386 RepID=UPI00257E8F0D|nr:hypothetical protein [Roseivirga sp. UBA1976]|tara:strand:- start:9581 stop:10339 length:759 start_codon:yes stop_codon:yes gene_type:complete